MAPSTPPLGDFDNNNGLLQASKLSIDVARYLNNDSGTMLHLGTSDAAINVGGKFLQASGKLETAANLTLRAGEISGTASKLNVGGNLTLNSGTTATEQGDWRIGGNARLETGALDQHLRRPSPPAGDLSLKADALNNLHGQLSTGGQAAMQIADDVDQHVGRNPGKQRPEPANRRRVAQPGRLHRNARQPKQPCCASLCNRQWHRPHRQHR
ncbi:hypothetical protein [Massilia eburnea]|uniref:hypothetical protein n=1 Tax=Massilia eburnea TaxID=1776165 RepID=UPI003D6B001D